MSGSASDTAVANPATNNSSISIDLGIGSAIRGNPEEQRAYIASKQTAINTRESEINTRYAATLFKINARDAELLNKIFQEQRTYLSENTSTAQKTIEDTIARSNNRIDIIVNGLVVRTASLQLIEIFETTVKSQPTINNKPITDSDKRALLDAAGALGKFYNANQESTKDTYLGAIVDILLTLKSKNAIFDGYLTTTLASGPEYNDIVRALSARKAGVVVQASDVILWDRLIKKIVRTFIIGIIVGLGLWGATLAANDVIFRPKAFRILNFIYGFIFFFVVLPYYLYRYFKKTSPTLFAMLPLTTYQPQTMFEKLIYGFFWYVEDKEYESVFKKIWYNSAIKESGIENQEEDTEENEEVGENEAIEENGTGANTGNASAPAPGTPASAPAPGTPASAPAPGTPAPAPTPPASAPAPPASAPAPPASATI